MAPIRIFGSRLSPFVEKVARACAWKGLDFELVEPASPADFRRWNPQTGKMPVAEIDGERVHDSTFILRRLDALGTGPSLWSDDPEAAAAQRMLEDWSDESLYWLLMALRWSEPSKAATLAQISADMPPWIRPLVRVVLARGLGRTPRAQGLGRLPHDVLVAELASHFDDLVTQLAGRPFFFGDRPSAADFALYGEFRSGCSGPTPEFERVYRERQPLLEHSKRVEDAAGLPE